MKYLALVCIFLVIGAQSSITINKSTFESWMCELPEACVAMSTESVTSIATKFVKRFGNYISSMSVNSPLMQLFSEHKEAHAFFKHLVKTHRGLSMPTMATVREAIRTFLPPKSGNASYPYFAFLPTPVASVLPNKGTVSFATKCFRTATASTNFTNAVNLQYTITVADQVSTLCTDDILLAAGGNVAFQSIYAPGTYTVQINVSEVADNQADKFYVDNVGVRVLVLPISVIDALGSLIDTVQLLAGFGSSPVPPATFSANYDFIRTYIEAAPRMQPVSQMRTVGPIVAEQIDPDVINSGDAMFVLRPDGLDPMIGWGEGATPGHSVVAVRFPPNNALHVCESTTLDAYWPTNGIQCHPWAEWVQLCIKAEMNIVLVPLAPKYSALFNTTAAINFFKQHQGTNYGFQTFLFGWLDTANDNFPCVPPNYETCLFPQTAELLAVLLDKVFEDNTENFFRQALLHRVGLWPQERTVPGIIQYAWEKLGIKDFTQLYTMVEQDDWKYNTTINGTLAVGKSMVCCVFVCNMWKASGLFSEIGNQLQCGEQTLWDIYSMAIFDKTKMNTGRPKICQENDPENDLCQLMGNFTFYLRPDVNTRPLYKNMGQNCGSKGPNYARQPGC